VSIGYIQLPPDSTGKKLRAVYHSDYGDYAEVSNVRVKAMLRISITVTPGSMA
jgi:hypothetical protein